VIAATSSILPRSHCRTDLGTPDFTSVDAKFIAPGYQVKWCILQTCTGNALSTRLVGMLRIRVSLVICGPYVFVLQFVIPSLALPGPSLFQDSGVQILGIVTNPSSIVAISATRQG